MRIDCFRQGMKRFLLAASTLALAGSMAMAATPQAATADPGAAGPTTLFNQHGLDVQAAFTATVGTLQNWLFVNADTEQLKFGADAAPTRFSEAVASLTQFDTSTGTFTHFDFCIPVGSRPAAPILPEGALAVDNSLTSATLHATFQCRGFGSVGSSLVAVDLTWTASSPKQTIAGTFRVRDASELLTTAFQDTFGLHAQANGTVSDGTQDFTPNPSDSASTFRFGQEQIEINQPGGRAGVVAP